jgi:hypothetical protein
MRYSIFSLVMLAALLVPVGGAFAADKAAPAVPPTPAYQTVTVPQDAIVPVRWYRSFYGPRWGYGFNAYPGYYSYYSPGYYYGYYPYSTYYYSTPYYGYYYYGRPYYLSRRWGPWY